MRKFTTSVFFLLTLFFSGETLAQEIATDNDGKPIFKIPNSGKVNPEVALNNLGIDFTPWNLKKRRYFVMNNGKKYTMHKSTTINVGASIANNEEDILLVGKDMDIAPHFEVGISRGIDKLFNPSLIGSYYTLSGAVFTDLQKFDLYDTVSKKFIDEKYKRWSYGAKISFNIFNGTKSAWAFNFSYRNSVVTDDYVSYQDRSSNSVYIDNNIVTNGDDNGYISPVTPKNNFRFSVAYPQFLKIPMAIIPYYFVKFGEITPKHNAGVLFTFLKQGFRDFDAAANAEYEFETAFSVGFNLISTGTAKKNYIFLSGTITIGKTGSKDDKDDPKDKKL